MEYGRTLCVFVRLCKIMKALRDKKKFRTLFFKKIYDFIFDIFAS